MENLIIIGSGPAGLTAAIYAARANLNPLLIGGYQTGGQLMLTTEVENYPGFKDGIMGPELMMAMRAQAERFGTRIIDKDVTAVDFSNPDTKKVVVEDTTYEAKSVIIATGATSRWLGVPGEQQLRGKGISTCATCDGAFFKNKVIAVVGGGDSAMEEAGFLTRFATKVYLIHRRNEFRASKIMQDKVLNNPKIEVVWNSVVSEVQGTNFLEKAILENSETATKSELPIQGLFIAIGHDPNTRFVYGQIDLDEKGYIKTQGENQTETNIRGVFVAGDVFDIRYKQAITAAGTGCKAALDAEKYLGEISI
jgi:thioredoxin reductase (NADPH)